MSTLEPLEPELAALFDRERAEHRPEPMARDDGLMRAERAIRLAALAPAPGDLGMPPPLPPPHGLLAGASGKVLLAAALAAAFGGGVAVGRAHPPSPAASSARSSSVVTASPADAPSPVLSPLEAGTPSIEASALPPAPTAPSAATAAPRTPPADAIGDLAKEQELVDTARGALARGRAAEAMVAAERHAARFPNGALAEEREALAVQALALDGRSDEARLRAARFTAKYPRSIFRAAVERAAQNQKQIP